MPLFADLARATAVLAALLACGCASAGGPARPDAPGRVIGFVRATGEVPPAKVYPPEPDMVPVCGHAVHRDETWKLGRDRGLANCVVVLRPAGDAPPPPVSPLAGAVFAKDGCGYSPRVLAVTEGTSVTLRNKNSPCQGFMGRAARNPGFNVMLRPGSEQTVQLPREEAIRVVCLVRERMVGWIVVVDTPWYAVTGPDGAFDIRSLPPGRYAVGVWHEARGWRSFPGGAPEIDVRPRRATHVGYGVPAG